MKNLNITFSDKDFQKLKSVKEKREQKTKERISWEDFVFLSVCGK